MSFQLMHYQFIMMLGWLVGLTSSRDPYDDVVAFLVSELLRLLDDHGLAHVRFREE